MKRRIFVDTEWTAPPFLESSELMWVALADEHGNDWYGISSEVQIDPSTNEFLHDVFDLITPDEPRLRRKQIAAAVLDFCGEVDELWAWVPSRDRIKAFFNLDEKGASEVFEKCWDVDLQMLKNLISPWPDNWPNELHDLNATAVDAGVKIPERSKNHLNPSVHIKWNRDLFKLISASRDVNPA